MFFNSEGRKIVLYLLYWVFHNLVIIINGIHTIAKDEFWTIIGFCKEYFTFYSNEVLQRTVINVTINSFLCCYAHYTNWRRFNGYVQGNNWFPKINKLDRVYSWFSKKNCYWNLSISKETCFPRIIRFVPNELIITKFP